jgi:hypothetical protein
LEEFDSPEIAQAKTQLNAARFEENMETIRGFLRPTLPKPCHEAHNYGISIRKKG